MEEKGIERDILIPIITERPGLMIRATCHDYSCMREFLEELISRVRMGINDYFIAFSRENGEGYFLYSVIVVQDEKNLKKALKECEKLKKEFKEVKIDVKPFLRFGNRYVPEWFPDLRLVDDYLAILRRRRYFAYIDALLETMGTGIYPLSRKMGEKDGREVGKEHKEDLAGIEKEKGPAFLIDFILRGIYYLRNFPQCEVSEKNGEILIEIIWKGWPKQWIKMGKHFIYGFITGFLKEFDYGVEELIEEGELVGLKVKKAGKSWKIVVEARFVQRVFRCFSLSSS